MAFDQTTRNRLARFVSDTRSLLAEEFTRQLQNDYGLDPNSGDVTDLARLEHLDDARRETARLLRDTMDHYLAAADIGTPAKAKKARQDVLDRIVREQAFTILNRLCALRMSEARGVLIESIANGYQSKGFQLYQRLAGTALGETGACYRLFIFSVFDEFAVDLPVLFDRFSPQGRLFPREAALLSVLHEINHPDIDPLWAEDETIGWIYQYFNSVEERRQMRAASQAPRNSRELAVRNQFFTPRYVVEFLTDNTLGRIWYEMTRGESSLKESCRYLVRRPTEIFLPEGEAVPEQDDTGVELSQEELLKQPVHILHRPLKDPRDIKMLDPACGSMHFGLYAFDLFERIYEEAWEIEAQRGADGFARTEEIKPLHESYTDKDAFLRDVPRLIIERNIHGIDIDPRAVQIAGLSLWLRAQRSWQVQNVKALDRPKIQRSNIVCAEPMPGEADMLEEFTEQLQPKVLGQLVKIIFEKMKLAGEAGSLLKIEEDIKDAIAGAHTAYREFILQKKKEKEFLPGMAPKRETQFFDFADLPKEEDFWHTAEQRVIDTLRGYAETAAADIFQRRLFAADAARGFAFIDLCRKRYDAVVMNPPFGLAAKAAKSYFEKAFQQKRLDFAACFISRFAPKSNSLAAITTRNIYFLSSYADWRLENLFDAELTLSAFADLGGGVLDGAMVEAALAILNNSQSTQTSFFRANSGDEKSTILQNEVQKGNEGTFDDSVRIKDRNIFRKLPTGALSYWADDLIIKLFESVSSFEDRGNEAWVGLQTNDDFQWVRLAWEVPIKSLRTGRSIGRENAWVPYAKGGEYKEYFPDIHLVVQWGNDGRLIKLWKAEQFRLGLITENNSKCWNESKYFERGVTWSQRSQIGLSVRALPEGCVFGIKGPAAFTGSNSPHQSLCVFNSEIFRFLVSLQMAFGSYDTGVIRRTPYPIIDHISEVIQSASTDLVRLSSTASCRDECHRLFNLTGIDSCISIEDAYNFNSSSFAEEAHRLSEIKGDVESRVRSAYGVDSVSIDVGISMTEDEDDEDDEAAVIVEEENLRTYASGILSKCLGCVIGRWDIRYATGERQPPELPDPFDPLPICPPGMLQNIEGLPAEPKDVPADYPLRISWPGIVVDDENHPEDIVARVREAIEVIWKDRAETIEQETLEILGVRSLREYFQRPANFFADHLKCYSKSRRYAPIYWPLSTTSGSYTLWLYYHRLTDQTLYTCVNDFVDPKLKQVSVDAATLRGKSNRSSSEEKELERLSELDLELKDFRDELLRIARFWKSNLNDGVQITAAPLWNLFQHRQWKARLKDTWEKLEAGDYDWAHLALSIWPDRVVRASHKDRSYSIAHDLEDLLWHEVEVEKVGRGGRVTTTTEWQPRDLSSADLQRIIAEVKAR